MKKGKNLSSVKRQTKLTVEYIEKLWGHFLGNPLFTSIIVFIIAFIIILSINFWVNYNSLNDYCQGLLIEGNGMLFDVIVVILIYNIIDSIRQRKIKIERYLEEIEDYRRWDSAEASHRISGIVRRLSRLKKTKRIDLGHCNLSGSNLQEIDFEKANFDAAKLAGSILRGSNFLKARFLDADLENTHAFDSNFQETLLVGAYLTEAHLEQSNFQGANLSDAKLNGAWLHLADFFGANLAKADFTGAFLYGTELEGAFMENATLEGASIELYQLKKVSSLDGAIMMDGTTYDEGWAKKIEESQAPN